MIIVILEVFCPLLTKTKDISACTRLLWIQLEKLYYEGSQEKARF